MSIPFLLLIALTAAAGYTDFRYRKIPNVLALAGLGSGLAAAVSLKGAAGLGMAAAGVMTGFGLMLLLHLCGALGAGDVKLFGAIGAIGGPWITLSIITYSILFAGMIGLAVLCKKRLLFKKGKYIVYTIIGFLFLKRWDILKFRPDKGDMIHFPFLLAVIPGLAVALWENMG